MRMPLPAVRCPPAAVCGHSDAHHGCAAGAVHRHVPLHGVHDGCAPCCWHARRAAGRAQPTCWHGALARAPAWGGCASAGARPAVSSRMVERQAQAAAGGAAAALTGVAGAARRLSAAPRCLALLHCLLPLLACRGCSCEGCGAAVQVHPARHLPKPHLRQQVRGPGACHGVPRTAAQRRGGTAAGAAGAAQLQAALSCRRGGAVPYAALASPPDPALPRPGLACLIAGRTGAW